MQTGGDILLEILKEAGVHTMFGIPSIHNLGFYEALRKDGSVRHILCRHETTATHMADGYARESGTPGVVITSTGPGAGYAVPALQEAYGSSSPVLMITTNIAASKIGKGLGTLHEVKEQDGIFKNITKAVFTVRAEEDIENLTREALNTLQLGRPGPVYLEVPTDLMNREIGAKRDLGTSKTVQQTDLPDLKEAITLIKNAERPLLVVGTAAVRACMTEEVVNLAETLAAPVIFTPSARGLIPDKHPLALGNSARSGTIRETASSSDLALAIGTRLREVDTKRRGLVLSHLIHVDWDNEWTDRNFPSNISLSGDMPGIVRALMKALESPLDRERRLQRVHEISLKIQGEEAEIRRNHREMTYLKVIRDVLPEESTLVVDNTQLGYWSEYFYPCHVPGGWMGAKGSAIIGFAFAAAIGAKIASPEKPIIAVIGDGGFLYSTQELATCLKHGIGFPVIIVNSKSFGIIAYLQKTFHKYEYESRLINPDFVALANAYGIAGRRVASPDDLGQALDEALSSGEMRIIELLEDFPEPPFGKY